MTISLRSEKSRLQQIRKLTEVSRALTYAVSLASSSRTSWTADARRIENPLFTTSRAEC
jgi:hypothetical protein